MSAPAPLRLTFFLVRWSLPPLLLIFVNAGPAGPSPQIDIFGALTLTFLRSGVVVDIREGSIVIDISRGWRGRGEGGDQNIKQSKPSLLYFRATGTFDTNNDDVLVKALADLLLVSRYEL